MSFRSEYKFRFTNYEQKFFQQQLLSDGMIMLYPPREISSTYFDTYSYQSFFDSEEGILPRQKTRIRSYPKTSQNFFLEKKISAVEGRYKESKMISSQSVEYCLKNGINNSCGALRPVIEVSYSRKYFLYRGMRVTFDNDIFYKKIGSLSSCCARDPECVVEVKVPKNSEDDFIHRFFQLPTRRFSKYCRGLELINIDITR